MQRVSEIIALEGEGGPVIVKDTGTSPPKGYDSMLAQARSAHAATPIPLFSPPAERDHPYVGPLSALGIQRAAIAASAANRSSHCSN